MIRQDIYIPAGQTVQVKSDLYGLLCIRDESKGNTAIYSLNNGNYALEKIMGFTFPGKDNPDTFNIYYEYNSSGGLGNLGLYLQNLASSQRHIKYSIL